MRSVCSLPKAHLHLHTEASAGSEAIVKLADKKNKVLGNIWDFNDFPSFNQAYDKIISLIEEPDDLAFLIHDFVKHEAQQGVVYIEPSIAPQFYTNTFHCSLEESFSVFLKAYGDAARENGICFGAIVTVIPQNSEKIIESVLRSALNHKHDGVVAFGTAGDHECGTKALQLANFCKIAHEGGLKVIPHAGEFEGPKSIWEVINTLHPDRIAHGIHAAEDPLLLSYLAKHRIICDVAISSNVRLNIYPSYKDHPVKELINNGVPVTLNCDDELFFKSSISNEYEIARGQIGLSDEQIAEIARTSIRAATLPVPIASRALENIDQWLDHRE